MITMKVVKDLSVLDRIDKQIGARVEATTDSVADRIVENIHQNWSPTSPSSPGERPAVVTGTLDLSVQKEKTGRGPGGKFAAGKDTFIRVIHVSAPYADILEHGSVNMLPRPFVLPAVLDEADNLAADYREIFSVKW